jgi:hypothetical protein
MIKTATWVARDHLPIFAGFVKCTELNSRSPILFREMEGTAPKQNAGKWFVFKTSLRKTKN